MATARAIQVIEANEPPALLSLRNISKRYPGVIALDGVDLSLRQGDIHAIVGENGAGKSTLIKIITGVVKNDGGEIASRGSVVTINSPRQAQDLGIVSVPQDVLQVRELPIGRNILLGMEGVLARRGKLSQAEVDIVQRALSQVGADYSPDAPTHRLSVPQLRLAQIARALVRPGDVMILDEPTAVLSEPDADHLLDRLIELRQAGKSIVYITHRLGEIMRIADRVTILRDGKVVGYFERKDFDRARIVALMAKPDQAQASPRRAAPAVASASGSSGSAVAATSLVVENISSGSRFANVSLTVKRGEIIGLAGVQGSGHGYVLRAIAGVDDYDSGEIRLMDKPLRSNSPRHALKEGLVLVPADRRGAGIATERSVQENIAFSPRAPKECRSFGFRSMSRERELTNDYINMLSIHPRMPQAKTGTLSGGNQQKVALARALNGDVQLLLADEPTQGIDVRARAEIHDLLRRIAREQNKALLVASSEFEELIGLADVIHVMRLGRLVATLPGDSANYHDILHEALP